MLGPAACLAVAGALALAEPALAADKVKLAVAQRGFWDSVGVHFADQNGYFKDENLDVSISWTQGGAETVQAVATGSVDVAIGTGFLGVIGAYAKGMPVRVIATHAAGIPDVFWYARSDSPIRTAKDFAGKKVAYSRPGSTSHLILLNALAATVPAPTLVSTGGLPATRTQLMTGQIDAAWSVPPFNLDLVRKGEARIVFRASEIAELQGQTIRVSIAQAGALKERRDVLTRTVKAYARALDWMYGKPEEAAAAYAKFAEIELADARETAKFYSAEMHAVASVRGLDDVMRQAVESKFIDKPMTPAQVGEMIDLVYDPKK
jgi:NitT/TauT family transport system substrate-binding protein